MRMFFRFLAWIVGAAVALIAIGVAALYFKSRHQLAQRYSLVVAPAPLPADQGAIARGEHIARTRGCTECHGVRLAGAKILDDPAMGKLYGSNLTHGRGGLPFTYRNEDWVRAIRHGIGSDGRPLILMPSTDYARFSEDDLGSLIAYLTTLPPVDKETVPIQLGPVSRALLVAGKMPLAAEEIDHEGAQPSQVPPGVTPAYGHYLAVGCTGCHGPHFAGGRIPGPPDWPPATNLTPDPSGAMAHWTEADFLTTLRTHKRPNGTELSPVMPRSYGQLNDVELRALWAYLRTLAPVPTQKS